MQDAIIKTCATCGFDFMLEQGGMTDGVFKCDPCYDSEHKNDKDGFSRDISTTVTLTLTLNTLVIDGEEIEDVVAAALGGRGYTGHVVCSETGNETHFPVRDMQPLAMLHTAYMAGMAIYHKEGFGADSD